MLGCDSHQAPSQLIATVATTASGKPIFSASVACVSRSRVSVCVAAVPPLVRPTSRASASIRRNRLARGADRHVDAEACLRPVEAELDLVIVLQDHFLDLVAPFTKVRPPELRRWNSQVDCTHSIRACSGATWGSGRYAVDFGSEPTVTSGTA